MKLLDSRRYTGPNVVWHHAGAVLDVECTSQEADRLIPAWEAVARQLLDAVGWQDEQVARHRFHNGVQLALSGPIDALYAAVEVAEVAYELVHPPHGENNADELPSLHPPLGEDHADEVGVRRGKGATPPNAADFSTTTARLRDVIAAEINPPLLALRDAAHEHGIAFLSDDDDASAGHGRGSRVWAVDALPSPDEVPWSQLHNVPVALVTGTNGKTTSVRMATAIARAAGKNVGLSSTDWVGVNDEVIDHGDYSGPGGARAALRHPSVDLAILETARGGLLRRGLGVERADAALITTIAEDHLGDFGSGSLSELLDIKWVVTRALDEHSHAVLNADDRLLVRKARSADFPIIWFALEPTNATLASHCGRGGQAMSVRDGCLAHFDGARWHDLCSVDDIPLTLNGTARHNISNALAAAGLALALGLNYPSIVTGLCGMTAADNPGRGNLFNIDGAEVLVDFAHNPQAIAAIFDMAARRPAKRRLLAFAQAGDRTDAQIRELAQVAWQVGLDRVIVSELEKYYRGREPGEVFGILREELERCGAAREQIDHYDTELESLEAALDWAQPGDLVIMLALADTAGVLARLN